MQPRAFPTTRREAGQKRTPISVFHPESIESAPEKKEKLPFKPIFHPHFTAFRPRSRPDARFSHDQPGSLPTNFLSRGAVGFRGGRCFFADALLHVGQDVGDEGHDGHVLGQCRGIDLVDGVGRGMVVVEVG